MSVEKIQQIARKYALQNAISFDGKANEKAVVGKVIAALKKENISLLSISPIFIFSPSPLPMFIEIAPFPLVFHGILGLSLTSRG